MHNESLHGVGGKLPRLPMNSDVTLFQSEIKGAAETRSSHFVGVTGKLNLIRRCLSG